jgi:hypothetical protein
MNSLIDILKELDIPYREHGSHHHATSRFIQIDCPFCSPNSGRFRMGLALEGWGAICWTCGHHKLGETLGTISGLPFWKLKQLLGDIQTTPITHQASLRTRCELPNGVEPLLLPHKRYLQSRRFSPKQLEKLWGIQGIGLAPRLAWRIFVPVATKGKIVSWTTRSLVDEGERYINARPEQEVIPLKQCLYGFDFVRHSIAVVEGPTDVWNIGPGAVGTFGVGYSKSQLLKISKIPVRLICFDSEPEAQKRAKRLCDDLSVFPGRTTLIELDAADPGSASKKEVELLRKMLN